MRVGLVRDRGIITSAYLCLRMVGPLLSEYAYQQLNALDLMKVFYGMGSGLRQNLDFADFKRMPILVPPHEEQDAIVRFLNHANGRIERGIQAKKKLVALLNEQRQAIIHRAVTRGLHPNVALKPSGIPWLSEIPKHWDVRPLKQLLVRMDYGTSENARGEGNVRVLGMGHIKSGRIVIPETGSLDCVPPGLLLEKHDLLFNRTNSPELVGKVGLFEGEAHDKITFASYLVRLRVRPEHSAFWLNYLLNSNAFWGYSKSQALVSLHQANLNSSRYARMILPVPSTRTEQNAIVESIRSQTTSVEHAQVRTEREISLLREYRTRLVSDVVTGKLDVREAARQLPKTTEKVPIAVDDEELEEEVVA